eukprot:CAMPEP_0116830088 /NCGR_PEP_ID=MMETSP0418-20121206/4571_1 /TAXON_ID=1158023 /ORGANISM="Astrosyne radiata, Strain 13vi08-1A" /LENGTH=163 /DNA_ID=CAMNT_0004459157 /DNA_START=169 /DNA_END=660 /DNA_ORIENTATION=-
MANLTHFMSVERDFRVKKAWVDANTIAARVDKVMKGVNTTLYIATDERNKTYFAPLAARHRLLYLDDFGHLLNGMSPNYYGMVDQLVAARGRNFWGCYWSTFSGYINRMRGYHHGDVRQGGIRSWYYVPARYFGVMLRYHPIIKPMQAREFPLGWRDIDKGIV